jgi:AcrR family transcriptional regulator
MSDSRALQGAERMTKHLEATALTRENLMQAFWVLYCQKKLEAISIKEIAGKAGYHRSTFYEYFVDIYDLLNQLEESLLAYIQENVVHSLAEEQSEDFIGKMAGLYETKGQYLSVLLGENGDPYFSKKLRTVMYPALVKAFGLPESDIHTAYIFEFGMAAIIASITHWYQSNKNLPSKELIFLIRSMLMNGVYPEIRKYSGLSSDPL